MAKKGSIPGGVPYIITGTTQVTIPFEAQAFEALSSPVITEMTFKNGVSLTSAQLTALNAGMYNGKRVYGEIATITLSSGSCIIY